MALKVERLQAKQLYIEEKKTIEEIAKLLPNVSIQSLYRWCSEENWDREREEISTTSYSAMKSMLRTAVARMMEIEKDIKKDGKINSSEVYALRQLILSAKSLQKDVDNYGNIILTMQEFTDFLAERTPEILKQLEPYLIEFGNTMSKKYGKRT
jgi:transposase-like protein